jgi:hypothetical protein
VRRILISLVALLVGLVVLAGYFFPFQLSSVLPLIIEAALLLVGAAGLIGIGYLVRMHTLKLVRKKRGRLFSIIFLIAFLIALVAGLALPPGNAFYRNLILGVQVPVEAGLLSVLAVMLLVASLKLIRTRGWTPLSIGFLSSALLSFIFDLGFLQAEPGTLSAELLSFLERLPWIGARGILLGMALGGLIVGLRVLLMIDRPYGEE